MSDRFGNTILEAAFEGVEFPVSESAVEGGHDIVEHTAYLRPGAELEPAGLKAMHGRLTVPLLNGIGYGTDLYPARYLALRRAIERNPIGQLTHPTEGIMTAAITGWKIGISPDNRSGIMLELDWIEHNASATPGLAEFSGTEDSPAAAEQSAVNSDALMDEIINGTRPTA